MIDQYIHLPVYWKRKGAWHVIRIPGADPKLAVVDRTLDAALTRAEKLFDVFIPAAQRPLTPLPPPRTPEAA